MAITTVDGIIAGSQIPLRPFFKGPMSANSTIGRPISYWQLPGIPCPGVQDTNGLTGSVLSQSSAHVAGAVPYSDPGSGNGYLGSFRAATGAGGIVYLVDRLWHNSGFTSTLTTAQTVNSVTFPARDNAGSTNGDGVFLGVEVSVAMGAASPTITVSYTNSAGTSGKSGTNLVTGLSSAIVSSFIPIGLAAGDIGVRSVQSLTLSTSWLSGTFNLVAYRIIAALDLAGAGAAMGLDPVTGGMPQIFNGCTPFLMYVPGSSANQNVWGSVSWLQG